MRYAFGFIGLCILCSCSYKLTPLEKKLKYEEKEIGNDGHINDINRVRHRLLDEAIQKALQDPDVSAFRMPYGDPAAREVVLADLAGNEWPAGYLPSIKDYQTWQIESLPERNIRKSRMLAISISRFEFPPPHDQMMTQSDDHPLVLYICDVGSNKDGSTANGGCFFFFKLVEESDEWSVKI